jgi:hypothetical protein
LWPRQAAAALAEMFGYASESCFSRLRRKPWLNVAVHAVA